MKLSNFSASYLHAFTFDFPFQNHTSHSDNLLCGFFSGLPICMETKNNAGS